MSKLTSKPFIPFDSFQSTFANIWLKSSYDHCKTETDIIHFAYECLNESEVSTNEVRSKDCFAVFNFLYQIITGESYQSKISI